MQLALDMSYGEVEDRRRLEATIAHGFQSFMDVGKALQEIRDCKLYRNTHGTFEEYCEDRWGISASRARQLVGAFGAMVDIKSVTNVTLLPQNEGQVRPLVSLEPEQRAAAWQEAVETATNGKVTGEHVERVVAKYRRAERVERINEIAANNVPLETAQRFPIIYADPPWEYEHSKTDSRRIDNHYPTMPLSEICDLPVGEVATPNAVLFLWATSPKLEEALRVMASWGFTYRTSMVWIKPQIGMGYYARQQHEFLLIGARGSLPVPEPANRPPSAFTSPRTEHSRKPEEYYEFIERMYPEYERIELFSRNKRDGWTTWGNQS